MVGKQVTSEGRRSRSLHAFGPDVRLQNFRHCGRSGCASIGPSVLIRRETHGATMKAAVGDRIAVAAATLGGLCEMARSSRSAATEDRQTSCAGRTTGARRSSSRGRTHMSVIMSCSSRSRWPPLSPPVWGAATAAPHVKTWSADLYLLSRMPRPRHAVRHTDARAA